MMNDLKIWLVQENIPQIEVLKNQLQDLLPNAMIEVVKDKELLQKKITISSNDIVITSNCNDFFQSILNHLPLGLYRTTPDGKILCANETLLNMVGVTTMEELFNANLESEESPIQYNRSMFKKLMDEFESIHGREFVWVKRNGDKIYIRENARCIRSETGKILYYEGSIEDVTKQRLYQERHHHKKRIENIERLTTSFVTEFNVQYSPLALAIQLLKNKSMDSDSMTLIEMMERQVEKCNFLLNQLLPFHKREKQELMTVDLESILHDVEKFVLDVISQNLQVQLIIPNNIPKVKCIAAELYQSIIHSLDALVSSAKLDRPLQVELKIETQSHLESSKAWIKLSLSTKEVLISDSFLTTNKDSFFELEHPFSNELYSMTNLQSVLEGMGGKITLETSENQSIISIYLPICEEAELSSSLKNSTTTELKGNGETILVVDDDKEIANLVKSLLETSNYKVILASDGIEALRIFSEHQNKISVLITDLMMPNLNGILLIETLLERKPTLKCIAVSGLITNIENKDELINKSVKFLTKPFSFKLLLQLVYNSLYIDTQ